jgi:hypothetical protein
MTSRDELLRLVEWLENYGNDDRSDEWYERQAAAIREFLEQEPVAWQNYEDRSLRYTQPEGFVARYYSPLYSEPVAAPAQGFNRSASHNTDQYVDDADA